MLTSTHGTRMHRSGECVIMYNRRRALGAKGMFNRQRDHSTRLRSRATCMLVLRSPKECHALRCSLAFAILYFPRAMLHSALHKGLLYVHASTNAYFFQHGDFLKLTPSQVAPWPNFEIVARCLVTKNKFAYATFCIVSVR